MSNFNQHFNQRVSGGKTRSTERSVAGTVRRFASATALVILWMTPSAFAFDPPPSSSVPENSVDRQVEATSTPQEQPSPAKPKAREKAQARKRNPALDRQLLRDLLPDLPPGPGVPSESPDVEKKTAVEPRCRIPFADELDETVYSMREVSRRLDTMELSDETEKLQSGIVTNIDALIEKLRKLPPPPSSDPSDKEKSDPTSSQDEKQEGKQRPQQTPQKGPGQGADSTSGSAPQPQSGKSGESTEQNPRQAQERAAALARRRALIDEVWGHLPPAMRERLLNVGNEKLLPRYEDLIRRYYESLAEPDKAGSRR